MAEQPKPTQDSNHSGCALVLVIIGLLFALSLCSKQPDRTSAAPPLNTAELSDEPAAPAQPPPPEPLSPSAAKLGFRHFKLVYGAEGTTGAIIYSRNCYDALGLHFSWAKLDTCGAFDMAAALSLAENDVADSANYFASESAAGRYLGAATKNGEESSQADQRLAALQRKAPKPERTKDLAEAEAALPSEPDPLPSEQFNNVEASHGALDD